jgi:hypothetical protein
MGIFLKLALTTSTSPGTPLDTSQWAELDYGMCRICTNTPLNCEHVTAPVASFSSDWDMFCSSMDTKTMSMEMPYLVYQKNMNRTWYSHGDFFYNANNLELNRIVTQLVQYEYTVQDLEK